MIHGPSSIPRPTTPRDPPKCRGLNFPGPAALFSQPLVQLWQTWGSRSWQAGWAGRRLRSARWGPDGCGHELSLQIKSVGRGGTSIGDLPRAIFGSPTSLMPACLIHPHPQPSRVSTAAPSCLLLSIFLFFSCRPVVPTPGTGPTADSAATPVVRVYGGDETESSTRLNRLLPRTPLNPIEATTAPPSQRHIIANDASSISNPLPPLQRHPLGSPEVPVTLVLFERAKGPKGLSRLAALARLHAGPPAG